MCLYIINYRPILFIAVISKLIKKYRKNVRITKILKRQNFLYEVKYGFRKGRNTNDAILDFTGNGAEHPN